MPYPKLSAALNNCALHAITPEIKEQVLLYAGNPEYDNNHNLEYNRLKKVFAEFYTFPLEDFSWQRFAKILEVYNPFDLQILLGPVLRTYMLESMNKSEQIEVLVAAAEMERDEYIRRCISINEVDNHRYRALSPEELAHFVAFPLGLSIQFHPQEGPSQRCEATDAVSLVQIYHSGEIDGQSGHWERVSEQEVATECMDYQNHDGTMLTKILLVLGENEQVNLFGMELLKKYIQLIGDGFGGGDDIPLACEEIADYVFYVSAVPKELAIRLLGENLTEMTRRFIDKYQFEPIQPGQDAENFIKTRTTGREQEVVKRLLSRLSPSDQDKLFSPELFLEFGQKARACVRGFIEQTHSMEINFLNKDSDGDVESHAQELGAQLNTNLNSLSGRDQLGRWGKTTENFPEIAQLVHAKMQAIAAGAVARKREILLESIEFEDYCQRFTEKAQALKKNGETTAAGAAEEFVASLVTAKGIFLEQKNKAFAESKRDLKEAFERALTKAKSLPAEQPGWKQMLAPFVRNLTSFVSQGRAGEPWTLFKRSNTLEETFEEQVLHSAILDAKS